MSNLATRSRLRIKAVALDLDGVVYLGDRLIAGADEAVQELHDQGIRVGYLTNNSRKTRAEIAAKLCKLGIPADEDCVINTAYAAGQLLRALSRAHALTIMVIGNPGLMQEVAATGVTIVEHGACDYVVVGLDTTFSYTRLAYALNAVCGGAQIIACNRDRHFPVEDNRTHAGLWAPGCRAGDGNRANRGACGGQAGNDYAGDVCGMGAGCPPRDPRRRGFAFQRYCHGESFRCGSHAGRR